MVLEKIPFLILALLGGARAIIAQQDSGAMQSVAQHDILARMAQACYGLVFYLWKTILPTNLSPLYQIPSRNILLGFTFAICALILIAITILAFKLRKRAPAIPAALAIYVAVIFPVLGFLQSGPQLVADRYSYLACMSLAVLLGAGAYKIMVHPRFMQGSNIRAIGLFACILLITQTARAAFQQSDIWLSARSLWSYAVKVTPDSPIVQTNYADVLMREDRVAEAFPHYQEALRLNADDPVANHRIADIYARHGQRNNAIRHYLQSLRADPNRRRACFSLAVLWVETSHPQNAVRVLQDGLRRHPQAIEMLDFLADLRATHPDPSIRDGQEAVRLAQRANQINGNVNPMTLMTLAGAYAEAGQFNDAVQTMQRALSLLPSSQQPSLADEMRKRLELFKNQKPYRHEP